MPVEWKGSKPIQFKMSNMDFTSILQVQSLKDGKLMKEVAKIEARLAKTTGYHVKTIEKSGKPL